MEKITLDPYKIAVLTPWYMEQKIVTKWFSDVCGLPVIERKNTCSNNYVLIELKTIINLSSPSAGSIIRETYSFQNFMAIAYNEDWRECINTKEFGGNIDYLVPTKHYKWICDVGSEKIVIETQTGAATSHKYRFTNPSSYLRKMEKEIIGYRVRPEAKEFLYRFFKHNIVGQLDNYIIPIDKFPPELYDLKKYENLFNSVFEVVYDNEEVVIVKNKMVRIKRESILVRDCNGNERSISVSILRSLVVGDYRIEQYGKDIYANKLAAKIYSVIIGGEIFTVEDIKKVVEAYDRVNK